MFLDLHLDKYLNKNSASSNELTKIERKIMKNKVFESSSPSLSVYSDDYVEEDLLTDYEEALALYCREEFNHQISSFVLKMSKARKSKI